MKVIDFMETLKDNDYVVIFAAGKGNKFDAGIEFQGEVKDWIGECQNLDYDMIMAYDSYYEIQVRSIEEVSVGEYIDTLEPDTYVVIWDMEKMYMSNVEIPTIVWEGDIEDYDGTNSDCRFSLLAVKPYYREIVLV